MVVGNNRYYLISYSGEATGVGWAQRDHQHLARLEGPRFIGLLDHPDLLWISIKTASELGKSVSFLSHIDGDIL